MDDGKFYVINPPAKFTQEGFDQWWSGVVARHQEHMKQVHETHAKGFKIEHVELCPMKLPSLELMKWLTGE